MRRDGMPAKTMTEDHHDLAEQALHWIVKLNSGESDPEQFKAFAAWRSSSRLNEQAAEQAEALWNAMSGLHVDPNNGLMRLSPIEVLSAQSVARSGAADFCGRFLLIMFP